ncbi:MAG TPA: hypothetical protein VFU37_01490 [Pyrinomonadaceae bacterium]|nr:hypothetical protein [Pyrinomonadaceae bacterium]
MGELQSFARLKIDDGKLDEFKRLAAKCAELVRTKDTGTLQYEQYINSGKPMISKDRPVAAAPGISPV